MSQTSPLEDSPLATQGVEAGEEASASPRPAQANAQRGADRRRKPTPRLSRFALFGGRRREVRREEEFEGSFVDRYGIGIFLAVVWIALMNIGDSFFTLVHLQAGGIELNPVAQLLLDTGRWSFVFIKSFLIALALTVLAVHKNFYLARIGLWTAAGTYTLLVGYHLLLFQVQH